MEPVPGKTPGVGVAAMESIRFSNRSKVITLWILVIVAVFLVWRVRDVALPFLWALVTAYIFLPLVRFLSGRTRVPRVWWIILLYAAAGALVYLLVAVLIPVVGRQYGEFLKAAPGILDDVQAYVKEHNRIEFYGITISLETISENLVKMLGDLARQLPQQALAGITLVLATMTKLIIYLIATFYFLLYGDKWIQKAGGLLPAHVQTELLPLFGRIHTVLTAYVRGQLMRMGIMGTLIYVGLLALQVRFALVLAIMGAILELVPIIGPIVAGAITTLVALFQPHPAYGWSNLVLAIAVVIFYSGLNQLEESFLIPNLLGYMVDLPPLLVIFVVLAGESLAGIPGLLLAVPIAATVHIVLRYLHAKLMDQPVLFEEFVRRRQRKRRRKKKEAVP